MKTYTQFILELTAYQRLERASWAKAAKRKTAAPKPKVKQSLPWMKWSADDHTGWYHPTHESFLFGWSTSNYHITQIVKSPSAFGITTADIVKTLEKYCKKINSRDPQTCAQNVLLRLYNGETDQLPEITNLVLDKGWAMVSIGNEIVIRANRTDTHKAAVREILETGDLQGKMIRIRNERNPGKDLTFLFVESAEKFLNS